MQIDRSNYEIWLIDWLDGNLSDSQVEGLKHFLIENPDLKEEFDELTLFRLAPSGKSYQYKNSLKKTSRDLSESQFDYYCAAYLENDLSAGQQTELMESIELDKEKKRSFELIQKTKLSPPPVSYKHKSRLIRRTVTQNVMRMSIIGLSAAAIITFLLVTYFSVPKGLPGISEKTARNIIADSIIQKPALEIVDEKIITDNKSRTVKKPGKDLFALSQIAPSATTKPDINTSVQNDSLIRNAEQSPIFPSNMPAPAKINIEKEIVPNTLIALKSSVPVPVYDDERSGLSKFLAKTFREKLLKESTPKDNPLKAYEIAEAGVSGLNKLFGWEMTLDKKNDENGELKSVYFSSKILKFNAPVKKSESLQ